MKFKAWMVYLIFLFVWLGTTAFFYFKPWSELKQSWRTTKAARDGSRGKYNSSTTSTAMWPAPPRRTDATTPAGAADKKQDEDASKAMLTKLAGDLKAAEVEQAARKAQLEKTLGRYMVGINRQRFNYDKPDEFVLEQLKLQREDAGPRLIQFLDNNYKNLFFRFRSEVPPPNINVTSSPMSLPPVGAHGELSWPVGSGPMAMVVYGRYNDLLNFVETFPDTFSRTAIITSFALQRLAFDYRGAVLLQLNTTVEFFVWPTNAPGSPEKAQAGGGAAAMGAPGMGAPGMGGSGGAPPGMGGPPMAGPPGPGGSGTPMGGPGGAPMGGPGGSGGMSQMPSSPPPAGGGGGATGYESPPE